MKTVKESISVMARRTMEGNDDWSMRLDTWDWNQGVGMYGLWSAYRYLERTDIHEFLVRWADTHMAEASQIQTINTVAPMLLVLELYAETREERYRVLCDTMAGWLLRTASRTCDGGFEHTVTEDVLFGGQMWADTLFMACIFLARYGRLSGNTEYLDLAVDQLWLHHHFLKDEATGLFYHGWDGNARTHLSGARWGRANAWIVAATVEILECSDGTDWKTDEIRASLTAQLNALKRCQRENGAFGTVLDEPASYDETSAAAGIAYGVLRGIKAGLVGEEYLKMAQRAFRYTLSMINENGEAEGVSGGTPILPKLEDYFYVPCYPSLYGQGLVMLMLCEEKLVNTDVC